MAYFAQIANDGEVLQVIVVNDNDILDANENESEAVGIAFCRQLFDAPLSNWLQTSDSMRKNFAGRGYTYDEARDAFISPYKSDDYILDVNTCRWVVPPVALISSDKSIIIGDGVDAAIATVRGALGATVAIDILTGDTLTSETIVLDTVAVTDTVGTAELVISCDTPGVAIVISHNDVRKELVVKYA